MKLKMLLLTVFVAGVGASFALADDGHGKKEGSGDHGSKCHKIHVNGTIAPQSMTITLDKESKKLNLAAGSQLAVSLGAAGQTVRVNVEACADTSGSATQLTAQNIELHVAKPHKDEHSTTTGTTATTTTTAHSTTTTP